jgi:hypothetical protein
MFFLLTKPEDLADQIVNGVQMAGSRKDHVSQFEFNFRF